MAIEQIDAVKYVNLRRQEEACSPYEWTLGNAAGGVRLELSLTRSTPALVFRGCIGLFWALRIQRGSEFAIDPWKTLPWNVQTMLERLTRHTKRFRRGQAVNFLAAASKREIEATRASLLGTSYHDGEIERVRAYSCDLAEEILRFISLRPGPEPLQLALHTFNRFHTFMTMLRSGNNSRPMRYKRRVDWTWDRYVAPEWFGPAKHKQLLKMRTSDVVGLALAARDSQQPGGTDGIISDALMDAGLEPDDVGGEILTLLRSNSPFPHEWLYEWLAVPANFEAPPFSRWGS